MPSNPTRLTPEREAEIRARLVAGTTYDPAPWHLSMSGNVVDAGGDVVAVMAPRRAVTTLIANAPADLADLLAEVEALRADAERLDWYASHAGFVVKYTTPDGTVTWQIRNVRYPSLRAAIDAARATESGGEHA